MCSHKHRRGLTRVDRHRQESISISRDRAACVRDANRFASWAQPGSHIAQLAPKCPSPHSSVPFLFGHAIMPDWEHGSDVQLVSPQNTPDIPFHNFLEVLLIDKLTCRASRSMKTKKRDSHSGAAVDIGFVIAQSNRTLCAGYVCCTT